MSKVIIVTQCGDCPYLDGQTADKTWFCMEPSVIDSYGLGIRLGNNNMETLGIIPVWCPLKDYAVGGP